MDLPILYLSEEGKVHQKKSEEGKGVALWSELEMDELVLK
jgi:hypothetical protein